MNARRAGQWLQVINQKIDELYNRLNVLVGEEKYVIITTCDGHASHTLHLVELKAYAEMLESQLLSLTQNSESGEFSDAPQKVMILFGLIANASIEKLEKGI